MEIVKRKVERERYLADIGGSLFYSADTINIQVYLTQNIEDLGIYNNYIVNTISRDEIVDNEITADSNVEIK